MGNLQTIKLFLFKVYFIFDKNVLVMNIAELKLNFFRQIDRLDKVKLEEAYGVLLNYLNSKDDLDEWNNLTAEQQKGLMDSIEQLDDNQGISHSDVINKYKNKYSA